MRVKFKLTAIVVNLYVYFTVQNVNTTFSPGRSFFKFREECTCINHTLSFEQQVITLIRVISQNMYGMFMIVHQKFSQEIRSERRRGEEQLELCSLILQTITYFQRTPCETYIFHFAFNLTVTYQFIFFLVHLHQRILFDPVDVLVCPFFGIFLVTRYTVCLTHRSKPFMTVQLPAEFIVFHRPVLPVDIFSVVVRRLITFMNKECMLQSVVRPLLFFFADSDLFQINIRSLHIRTGTVVVEQCFCGILIFAFLM